METTIPIPRAGTHGPLTSRGRGHLRGFLELRHPWGFSPEARRGSQGASRAAPGKSCLHARVEKERVIVLESWEGTRASRRVEEGLSRSFSGCSGKPSFPSPSAGDLRELPRVPLRGKGRCGVGGASRDSTGMVAMEEGLISSGGRTLRLPLQFWTEESGRLQSMRSQELDTNERLHFHFSLSCIGEGNGNPLPRS